MPETRFISGEYLLTGAAANEKAEELLAAGKELETALTMMEYRYGKGVTDIQMEICEYALQFVGNPYRWGGTSLTKGADCSGFTLSVYANYGVSLPHSSRAQANCGTRIDVSEVQENRQTIVTGIKGDGNEEKLDVPTGVLVYEIEGPLFFATVRKFELAVERAGAEFKVLVIRMRNTIYLDAGGVQALEQCKAACDRKGVQIVISGIHSQPYLLFEKTGMADKIGRENIFDNINEAMSRAKQLVEQK